MVGEGNIECLRQENQCVPVTALAFITHQGNTFLLSGEGSHLKIIDYNRKVVRAKERLFRSQAIHGIIVQDSNQQSSTQWSHLVLVWGGCLIQVVRINLSSTWNESNECISCVGFKIEAKITAPDWILAAAFAPSQASRESGDRAVFVTAHNVLLLLEVRTPFSFLGRIDARLHLLCSGPQSILYSAHVLWQSASTALIAAGTVFGDITIWSCHMDNDPKPVFQEKSRSSLHQLLSGHEGSVFGVQLSPEIYYKGSPLRFLASCSDDRTIRIWLVSTALSSNQAAINTNSASKDVQQDTGFRETRAVSELGRVLERPTACVAIGWAHISRVWGVCFLPFTMSPEEETLGLEILSYGEDATSRSWSLFCDIDSIVLQSQPQIEMKLHCNNTYSFHSGKSIWSVAICSQADGRSLIATGGADGRIISFITAYSSKARNKHVRVQLTSLTEHDRSVLRSTNSPIPPQRIAPRKTQSNKLVQSAKRHVKDGFQHYAPLRDGFLLMITCGGRMIVAKISNILSAQLSKSAGNMSIEGDSVAKTSQQVLDPIKTNGLNLTEVLEHASTIDSPHDIVVPSYQLVKSNSEENVAFLATSDGVVYGFDASTQNLERLLRVNGKLADMFLYYVPAAPETAMPDSSIRSEDQGYFLIALLFIDSSISEIYRVATGQASKFRLLTLVPIRVQLPQPFVVTAFSFSEQHGVIILGSRSGSCTLYTIQADSTYGIDSPPIIEKYHAINSIHDDTITSIQLLQHENAGQVEQIDILTTSRDGSYAITHFTQAIETNSLFDVGASTSSLLHKSFSSQGPDSLEGAYFRDGTDELVTFGFSGTDFVVYSESQLLELFRVNCGNSNRSWMYSSPHSMRAGSFTFTRAGLTLTYEHTIDREPIVLQAGCHGRDIKAVAAVSIDVADSPVLYATGAEDCRIRLFVRSTKTYNRDISSALINSNDKCAGVLKAHTTGIQDLKWTSHDQYLLSSGGRNECFVWRVRKIERFGYGAVQVTSTPKDSSLEALRITSIITVEINAENEAAGIKEERKRKYCTILSYSDGSIRVRHYALLLKNSY